MTLQASKTCKVWIHLNPSVFSSGCLRIPSGISLSFLNDSTLIHCCWMPFTVGCFPFYNVILGFPRYHWFPPFAPLGTRTNVMLATLVAGPFLIPHYFLLFGVLPQKPLVAFPFWGVLKELTFGPSSFKASKSHLFKLNFWLFFPLSFFPSELIPSCQIESFLATFLHGSSFWVPRGTSPLFMNCWFSSLLILFLHHQVADRDLFVLVPCVSWHPPWTILIQP